MYTINHGETVNYEYYNVCFVMCLKFIHKIHNKKMSHVLITKVEFRFCFFFKCIFIFIFFIIFLMQWVVS